MRKIQPFDHKNEVEELGDRKNGKINKITENFDEAAKLSHDVKHIVEFSLNLNLLLREINFLLKK